MRATRLSKEWDKAHLKKGETPSLYNDLFDVFGVKRQRVAVYEQQEKIEHQASSIDLFWPSILLIRQKNARWCWRKFCCKLLLEQIITRDNK